MKRHHHLSPVSRRFRTLGFVFVVALLAAACGGEETVSAGNTGSDPEQGQNPDNPENSENPEPNQPDDDVSDDSGSDKDGSISDEDSIPDEEESMPDEGEAPDSEAAAFTKATPSTDMISIEHAVIDSVEPIDDTTLGVRYWNGSEPCALANVIITESESSVTVRLETGLHPDVAAMSCLAESVIYEMPVTLASPLGDREIVLDDPAGTTTPDDLEPASTEQYVGLSLEDAEALAAEQGRDFRVVRKDDEQFAVTEDYSPDRVNVEVDDGIVTTATAG